MHECATPRPPQLRRVLAAVVGMLALMLAACGSGSVAITVHRATPTATIPPPLIYVAIGASDAVGIGATDPNTQGYIPRLIARLPAHSKALNLGINGIVLHDALVQELPQAVATAPTLVTVWLIGNDFKGCTPLSQYGADLNMLLGQLRTRTHAAIFVANTPDMSQLPYFQQGAPGGKPCVAGKSPAQIRALAQQWNAVIDPIVANHGAVLVDLFNSDLAAHPEYVYSDGFHPSSAGYAVLANIFWSAISAHHAVPLA
ncbi:MAG: GDSL-type esterase/lipase family protein [Ktedonobacterales bacterium]